MFRNHEVEAHDTSKSEEYLKSVVPPDCTEEEIEKYSKLLSRFVYGDCNVLIVFGTSSSGKSILTKVVSSFFEHPYVHIANVQPPAYCDLLIYIEEEEANTQKFLEGHKSMLVTNKLDDEFLEQSFYDKHHPIYFSLTNTFTEEKVFSNKETDEISRQLLVILGRVTV